MELDILFDIEASAVRYLDKKYVSIQEKCWLDNNQITYILLSI